MTPTKRPCTVAEYSKVLGKKQQRASDAQRTISCLEKLPNEIFLEIFEYLEGEKLYNAFKGLNARFGSLLDASNLRIQAQLSVRRVEAVQDYFHNVILPNAHRILALGLSYRWSYELFHSVPLIDAPFVRLESLRLDRINSMNLMPLLISLVHVPRLTSLKVSLRDGPNNISDIYRLIFALPSIKFVKLSTNPFLAPISLSMLTTKRYTRSESLVLDHQCTVNDLLALLTYTPQLCRLKCECIIGPRMLTTGENTTAISTLTRISMGEWRADFDHLETLLANIAPNLQCLSIGCARQMGFLNPDRWERLITEHLPHLWRLNFTCEEAIDDGFVVAQHHQHIHRFSYSFWIERYWWFNIVIDTSGWDGNTVCYTISTDKGKNRKSIDQQKEEKTLDRGKTTTFPTILPEGNRLYIKKLPNFSGNEFFIRLISPMLALSQITCLHIDFDYVFAGVLTDLMQHLPHLHSLVIKSLASMQQRHLSVEGTRIVRSISQKKAIHQVQLINAVSLSEIQFLLDLCSGMQYLQIDNVNDIDLASFVRLILMKYTESLPNLFFVRCGCPPSNIDLLQKLINMIDLEQLRRDYTIEQIQEKIYLRWTI